MNRLNWVKKLVEPVELDFIIFISILNNVFSLNRRTGDRWPDWFDHRSATKTLDKIEYFNNILMKIVKSQSHPSVSGYLPSKKTH